MVLPSGIDDIKTHIRDVDNVPLLVPLFSRSNADNVEQMIGILQSALGARGVTRWIRCQ